MRFRQLEAEARRYFIGPSQQHQDRLGIELGAEILARSQCLDGKMVHGLALALREQMEQPYRHLLPDFGIGLFTRIRLSITRFIFMAAPSSSAFLQYVARAILIENMIEGEIS